MSIPTFRKSDHFIGEKKKLGFRIFHLIGRIAKPVYLSDTIRDEFTDCDFSISRDIETATIMILPNVVVKVLPQDDLELRHLFILQCR